MKIKRNLFLVQLCCFTCSFAALFDISRPFTVQQKQWWPWTAFFNSMFAKKELATGKYPIRAEISGYIAHEPFWDSRQVDSLFEGLFLFAPKPIKCDPRDKDINAVGQFNIVVMETKGRAKLYGPEVLGAESFGYLEADFVGSDIVADRIRCRLARLKLTWKEIALYLLTGLYYHPIRLAHIDLDPKVVSHNVGAPLHANVRSLQVKISKSWHNTCHLECTAIGNFDETDFGLEGPDNIPLQRSLMPMMDIRMWLGPENTDRLIGVGFDIKRLMPKLVTNKCVRTRKTITSVAFDIYAKLTAKPLSVRTQCVWAQNAADFNMLGGYAVTSINPITGERSYTNISTLSYWIDFNIDKKISPGFFGGYTKVLGTGSPIIPAITNQQTGKTESLVFTRDLPGTNQNIAYVARLAPRVRFNVKPIVFSAELEWTRAGYGVVQTSGNITQITPVSNIRFILASYYFF